MVRKTMVPPPDELRNVLSYEPMTGTFTWLSSDVAKFILAGSLAGSLHKATGYYRIVYLGRQYAANRLAWWFMTGEWPAVDVDHKNLCKADNTWDNLRLATNSQNQANRASYGSCLKGVTRHKTGRFQAQIRLHGKRRYLGLFETEQAAHEVYMAVARDLYGEFARAA